MYIVYYKKNGRWKYLSTEATIICAKHRGQEAGLKKDSGVPHCR